MEPSFKKQKLAGHVYGTVAELEKALPPLWHEDERVLQLRCATLCSRVNGYAPLAVVDDDPTGTQTVHSVPVVADWSVPNLSSVVNMDRPCFYILSNTRALPAEQAVSRAEEIGRNLRAAAEKSGVGPLTAVLSRGDSTLRGHYPAETEALARGLGWGDGGVEAPTVILAPFFKEGGRLTAFDVHYVAGPAGSGEDGSATLTPAGETEFAKDKAFGYKSSHLADWVAEKNAGKQSAPKVISLDLELVRLKGPEAVSKVIVEAPAGTVVIANAVVPRDMQVIGLGCLAAELKRGPKRPLLYRSAGAMVAARAAIPARPLLAPEELVRQGSASASAGGLVVVGSYVSKSTDQLSLLLEKCAWLKPVEMSAAEFVSDDAGKAAAEVERVRGKAQQALDDGESAVLYTSRTVLQNDGAGGLHIGERINDALCGIVQALLTGNAPPAFLVAKGGITSNDVAVRSLGVRKAEVLGAIVPGVPVWRCGEETRAPGLAYVVFPGNVGAKDDLARVACKMAGKDESSL